MGITGDDFSIFSPFDVSPLNFCLHHTACGSSMSREVLEFWVRADIRRCRPVNLFTIGFDLYINLIGFRIQIQGINSFFKVKDQTMNLSGYLYSHLSTQGALYRSSFTVNVVLALSFDFRQYSTSQF